MRYNVIGKSFYDVYREFGNDENIDSIIESFYENQTELFNAIFPKDEKVIYHYIESDSHTIGYTSEIDDYIQCLAIKDGVNLVQFKSGYYGFMAYYGGHENGFEIMPLSENVKRG